MAVKPVEGVINFKLYVNNETVVTRQSYHFQWSREGLIIYSLYPNSMVAQSTRWLIKK